MRRGLNMSGCLRGWLYRRSRMLDIVLFIDVEINSIMTEHKLTN